MFCTKCGKQLPDGAKFCFECGAAVGQKTDIKGKRPRPKKKVSNIAMPIVCAAIAVSISLYAINISSIKYIRALTLMDTGKYDKAIIAFSELGNYMDCADKIVECEKGIQYDVAVALLDNGNVMDAYEALLALDGYKDSNEKADSIHEDYVIERLNHAEVGDYVFFGAYEQDNNISNGKEALEWLVLDKKDGKVLVISKYSLDCQPYNEEYSEVTWETCTLRKWLNNDFINTTFSDTQKAMIPTVTVSADKNPEYNTYPGSATQDRIFLLSIADANKYFSSDSARQCKATIYANAQGAWVGNSGNCWWWLRSPGYDQHYAAQVNYSGSVDEFGTYSREYFCTTAVRPAMWINLENEVAPEADGTLEVVVTQPEVADEVSDTFRVWVTLENGWENVSIYAWSESAEGRKYLSDRPQPMVASGMNSYYYDLPSWCVYACFVTNDNMTQTRNFVLAPQNGEVTFNLELLHEVQEMMPAYEYTFAKRGLVDGPHLCLGNAHAYYHAVKVYGDNSLFKIEYAVDDNDIVTEILFVTYQYVGDMSESEKSDYESQLRDNRAYIIASVSGATAEYDMDDEYCYVITHYTGVDDVVIRQQMMQADAIGHADIIYGRTELATLQEEGYIIK